MDVLRELRHAVRRVHAPRPSAIQPVPKLHLEEEPCRAVVFECQRDEFTNAFDGQSRTQGNAYPPTEGRQEEHDAGRAAELGG